MKAWLRSCIVILLAGWSFQVATAAAAPVLVTPPGLSPMATPPSVVASEQGVMRARTVLVDTSALRASQDALRTQSTVLAMEVPLFEDVTAIVSFDRAERLPSGSMAYTGQVLGKPWSSAVLVELDGLVVANFVAPGFTYQIRYSGSGLHEVRQIEQSAFSDHGALEVPEVHPPAMPDPDAMTDTADFIDVLIPYTAAARAGAGGTTAMHALIDLGITETNAAYATSGVVQRIRLAGRLEVPYADSGDMSIDLNRLRAVGDGYMDEVHTARNAAGADLVSLWVDNGGSGCGIGYFMGTVSSAFATSGFNVVARSCATGNYSFGHELGHNMGLRHDIFVDAGTTPYAYAHGYADPPHAFRTIMAYNDACVNAGTSCTRIQKFSNPAVSHGGFPSGNATANAAQALNNTALTVANFRTAVARPPDVFPLGCVMPTGYFTPAGATAGWFVDSSDYFEGSCSLRSVAMADAASGQVNKAQVAYTGNFAAGNVNFKMKVSSEAGYDCMRFLIDGVQQAIGGTCSNMGGLGASGGVPWMDVSVPITPGQHTLVWSYEKDYLVANGADAAWIDAVSLPVAVIVPSTTTLSSSANPSWRGLPIVFTATVTGSGATPTGTVTFREGGADMPGCVGRPLVSGTTTCTTTGNVAGAYSITASYSGSATYAASVSAPLVQVVAARAGSDFNGDGMSDVLFRNTSTGQVFRLTMAGTTNTGGSVVLVEPNTAWRIAGDADFNGDGVTDVLWHNGATGQVFLNLFSAGGTPAAAVPVTTEPNLAWKIVQTPDLNGDGKADILWWNASTGQVFATLMNGGSVLATGHVHTEPNLNWRIVAAADFSGSGRMNQILWRNLATGQVFLQTVDYSGGVFSQFGQQVYHEPDVAWEIVGVADFNGDGRADMLWRNELTGQASMVLMNGPSVIGAGQFHVEPNLAWKIVAQGDYNGDGRADILWRNDLTGQVFVMLMNGLTAVSQAIVYTDGNTAWRIQGPWEYGQRTGLGTGVTQAPARTDFNADGKSDILWRNAVTGMVFRSFMNGATPTSSAFVHSEANTAWKIVGDADFNGDGVVDLLYRNDATGQVYYIPFGTGGVPIGGGMVTTEPNLNWKIVHTPDLDGDGRADILWWNAASGQVFAMLMNGSGIVAQGMVHTEANTAWRIVGVGDFAGIGKSNQLLWRNAATGQVYQMTVNHLGAGVFTQSGLMVYQANSLAWKIVAVADYDGDGRSDMLWRHDATGDVYVMLKNGPGITGQATVHGEPNLAWKVVASGDHDGDGKADILFRNESTGQVFMLMMNGLVVRGGGMVYQEPNTAWKIMGPWEYGVLAGTLASLDGDGKAAPSTFDGEPLQRGSGEGAP